MFIERLPYYHQPLLFIPSVPLFLLYLSILQCLSVLQYFSLCLPFPTTTTTLVVTCIVIVTVIYHKYPSTENVFLLAYFLGQRRRMLVSRLVHAHCLVLPNPIRVEGSHGAVFLQLVCGNTHGCSRRDERSASASAGYLLLPLNISTPYYYCTGEPLLYHCCYHHFSYILVLPLYIQCIIPT